jgi:hypothetical protein
MRYKTYGLVNPLVEEQFLLMYKINFIKFPKLIIKRILIHFIHLININIFIYFLL